MNIDKFTIDTQPFEKTLTFRLASPALDQSAAAALGEWNSPLIYGEFDKNNIYYDNLRVWKERLRKLCTWPPHITDEEL